MSVLGFVSLFIVVISVTIIILHYRLMRKRAPVDVHFDHLEELLRQWIEDLYSVSPIDSELYSLCGQCIDLGLAELLSTAPFIVQITQPDTNTETAAITETISALNRAIMEYNAFISKSPVNVLMASILGLKTVEPVAHVFERDSENPLHEHPELDQVCSGNEPCIRKDA